MCGAFRPKKPKAAPPPPVVAVKDVTPVTDVQFTAPVATAKKRKPQGKGALTSALGSLNPGGLSF